MKLFVYLAALAALVAVVSAQGSTVSCSDRTDIVLVLDGSESISDQDFEIMKNASISFTEEAFQRINQLRIGAVVFGTDANTFLQLTNGRNMAIQALNSVGRPVIPSTFTNEGIKAARNILTDPTSKRIMIVITDGSSNNPTTTEMEADSAKSDGIIIFTVGVFKFFNSLGTGGIIQDFRNEFNTELRTIASNPTQVVAIEDFSTLADELTNLLDDVCNACSDRTDIVLVLDGSESISDQDFEIMKNASISFTEEAFQRINQLRIGAVVFGTDANTFLQLTNGRNMAIQALNSVGRPVIPSTFTHEGIKAARNILTDPTSKRIMIVITDGSSNNPTTTEMEADSAKSDGIIIFTVGVFKFFNSLGTGGIIQDFRNEFNTELRIIASNPTQVVAIEDFSTLADEITNLLDNVCIVAVTFLTRLFDRTAILGETVTLIARTSGTSTSSYSWTKNGVTINNGLRVYYDSFNGEYRLVITNVEASDAGTYTLNIGGATTTGVITIRSGWGEWTELFGQPCSVSCGSGVRPVTFVRTCLSLPADCPGENNKVETLECDNEPCPGSVVFFTVALNNVVVDEGQSFVLTGTLNKVVSANYQWRRNGVQLIQDGRVSFNVVGSIYTLSINNAQASDAGRYTLTVGTQTSSADVTVNRRAFAVDLNNDTVSSGDTITLTGTLNNAVTDTFRWSRNGVQLSQGGRISFSVVGSTYTLTITGASQDDAGEYILQVGSRTSTGFVNFQTICVSNMDVMLAIDGSGSIGRAAFGETIIPALQGFVSGYFQSSTDRRLGYVLYSTEVSSTVPLSSDVTTINQALSTEALPNGDTFTNKALAEILTQFQASSRPEANKFAIVITDGKSDDGQATQEQGRLLKELNTTIIVVGVTDAVNRSELLALSSGPQYVQEAQAIADLADTLNVLIQCDPTWGAWRFNSLSTCNASCNGGYRVRTFIRDCQNASPTTTCTGSRTREVNEPCNTQACPQWSAWGADGVGLCSVSCGSGNRIRRYIRVCLNQTPTNNCEGSDSRQESEQCFEGNCPAWSEWDQQGVAGGCSVSCGGGTRTRTYSRTCLNGASLSDCGIQSTKSEQENCNEVSCPAWSAWIQPGVVGGCSVSCGGGTRTRTYSRTCLNGRSLSDCGTQSTKTEQENCNALTCPAVWSQWSEVRGDCSELCGTSGTRTLTRSRQCLSGNCQDETTTTTEACNRINCLIFRNLVDVTVNEGTSQTFLTAQVVAAGVTGGQWFKGGVIVNDGRFFATSQGVNRSLIISNVEMGDAGTYTYVRGNEVTQVRLVVVPIAVVWSQWTEVRGDCSELCGTSGTRTLTRSRQCLSGNCQDETITTTEACNRINCLIFRNLVDVTVNEGTSQTFLTAQVVAVGVTGGQWFKGGVIVNDGRFFATSQGVNRSLIISNVEMGDAGTYTYVRGNEVTQVRLVVVPIAVVWSQWTEVRGDCSELCGTSGTRTLTRSRQCLSGNCQDETITTTEACNRINCLSFRNLVDITVIEGTQVAIVAQVISAGVTGGQWLKDGQVVSGSRFTTSSEGTNRILRINDVQIGDAGTYRFVLGNELTEVRLVVIPLQPVWGAWEVTSTGACDVSCGTGNRLQNRTRVCQEGSCQGPTEESTLISCTLPSCNVCQNDLEVMLAIDSSSSIGRDSFDNDLIPAIKNFTLNFLNGRTDRKLGFVVYSTFINNEVPLSNNADTITSALDGLGLPNGDTSTDLALGSIIDTFNSSPASTNRIAIVITDGASSNPSETTRQGNILKGIGVTIVTVGVGAESTSNFASELRNLASSTNLVFLPENFGILLPILLQIAPDCPVASWSAWVETSVSGCTLSCGGGIRTRAFTRTCPNTATSNSCVGSNIKTETETCNITPCPAIWGAWEVTSTGSCDVSCGTGNRLQNRTRVCQEGSCQGPTEESTLISCTLPSCNVCQNDLEVMLAIDSSSSIGRDNFDNDLIPAIKNFTLNFLNGRTDRKLGFVVYSTFINNEVPLSNNADTITSALDGLGLPNGDTSTDLALGSIIDTFNSSPASTNRIAIVITDGASSNPSETTRQGNILKGLGVTIVTVGVGAESTSNFASELRNLASSTNLVFLPENFGILLPILLQIAPDCPVASWSEWVETSVSGCTVTCGGGIRTRAFTRTCIGTATPTTCVGSNTRSETETCNTAPCAGADISYRWLEWVEIRTECSVTCGGGTFRITRTRSCEDPTNSCQGPSTETILEACNTKPCAASFGQWTEWGFWNPSCPTCGPVTIVQVRTRVCRQLPGAQPCPGDSRQNRSLTCSVDSCQGTWNTWGSWSTPSCPSCGVNEVRTVSRTRTCSQAAGQDPCEGTNTEFQTVTCVIDRCLGTWNIWGSWSTPTCPSCGFNEVRTVTRTRTCSQAAGQDPCEGTNTDFQTVSCVIDRCLGTWNTWGSWSTPSCPSCGVNEVRTVNRTRTCSQAAGQDPCEGTNTEFQTVTCVIDRCLEATWQQWGAWSSPCPSPCSNNPQTLTERRTRGCDRQGAVSDCAGLSEESRSVVCTLCPEWRQWSDWSSSCPAGCSNAFIEGVRTRRRTCDTRGSTLTCSGSNLESLPDTCTFCPAQWSTWGSWSGPSCPDCGLPQTTRQTRVRNCNPFTGQPTCVGDRQEFRDQPCNIVNCRGTYGPWTQWSLPNCPDCGAPGMQRGVSRTRSCQKMMPSYDDCVGSDVDNKIVTCQIEQCDTGVWAPWSTWSNPCPNPCSDTPVNRLQSRSRVCNKATPTDRDCPGDSSESQNVDCTVCGVGRWTEWTQWSPPAECPACGFNVFQDQSRTRQCIQTGFESPCTGDRSQSRRFDCQIPRCPSDPGADNLGLCLNVRNISGVGYRYHPEDCDKYVQCYFNPNGEVTAIYRPCPFGHYWSQATMRCDFSWRVNCPHERCNDTCVSTHNMEGSCRAYWSCEKGRSEAKCCPHFFRYVPGSGCQYDPLCQDPCPSGCSPRDACDKAPVWTDPQMFRVNVGLLGWMESKCINGSAFDLIDCGCSLKKPSTCKSEFDLNFDNPSDLNNAIGNWLTSESVKVEGGVAKFDGVGKLTADTKLSEAGVSCPFVLQFRYLRTGSGRTRQVMASSKDCTHGNTMVISQYNDSVVIELMSWFGPLMRLPISTENLDPSDWKDFTLVYNGKLLTAMIRDSNYRVMAQFSAPKVLLGACGLHFGSDGSIMTAFEGQMDDIHLYKCDPGNLF